MNWKWLVLIIGGVWLWSQMKPTEAIATPTPTPPTSDWVLVRAYKGTQMGMTAWIPPENVAAYLAGDWVLA